LTACALDLYPNQEKSGKLLMKKEPYRRVARIYDRLFGRFNSVLHGLGMKMSSPVAGMNVLDVGCGTGTQLELYQKAGCRVFGIDPSAAMLKVARARLSDNAELLNGDASATPYADGQFDLITMKNVLHEMSPDVRSAVLNECNRILKDDGRILLVDFHPGPIRGWKGWFYKCVIFVIERAAGGDHYRNYRHFQKNKGLPGLISARGFSVDKERIVTGGNMALYLLQKDKSSGDRQLNR
jgi:ubiquinone/menaquinone biosynthesis C-methylase UbiE